MAAGKEFVSLRGDKETEQRLNTKYIVANPARNFLKRWGFAGMRGAKRRSPRYQGHLRRSITTDVDSADMPTWARFGTNLGKPAMAMEGGTGLLADLPGGTKKRHMPPLAPLIPWALKKAIPDRHHPGRILTGRDIQWIIYRRGGLKPRRFLRNTVEEDLEPRIPGWIKLMGREMVAQATRKANKV